MTSAEATARGLAVQADQLSKLEPTIKGMSEKIEEAMLKIGDLQRQSVSERSDTPVEAAPSGAMVNGAMSDETTEDECNWTQLRELWNANGVRLDEAIERIPEKRKRTRFPAGEGSVWCLVVRPGIAISGSLQRTCYIFLTHPDPQTQ